MSRRTRLAAFAALATALAASTGAFAQQSERITIGDLTFNYKATSWRIEHLRDGLIATCVQEDCRGAVVDISRREGEAGCTEERMVAEAEQLFPAEGRAYANMRTAGRFALILAERHDGPDLTSPQFAYGCVAWQGSEYRFAMRPETVGTQSWIGGALHYLVSQATAPDAIVERRRIGEVDFHISTETWTIGDDGEVVWLTCRMPTCHEPDIFATLSVRSPAQPCPPPVDPLQEGDTRIEILPTEAPDGLDFTISETSLGCRNFVPPRFEACTAHDGKSYHLSTFGAAGCRSSIWDIPREALVDLLKAARTVN